MLGSRFAVASVVILAAMASLVIELGAAAGEPEATSPTPAGTYFGVDANNKEAVEEKQRELSHQKWREMMGDVDMEDIEFAPNLESNPLEHLRSFFKGLSEAGSDHMQKVQESIKDIADKAQAYIQSDENLQKGLENFYKKMSSGGDQEGGNPLKEAFEKLHEMVFKKN